MARSSVNRPPTPESDDQPRELVLEEKIRLQLVQSGERDRLSQLLRDKLIQCGWRDELKARCREVVKKRGVQSVTVEELVRAITPEGRASVPDSVKAELLSQIKDFIHSLL